MKQYRKHIRHPNINYSSQNDYFITLCSVHFLPFFSEIINNVVILKPIGEIINYAWLNLPNQFPNVKLGAFVIMPNHFRGLIRFKHKEPSISLGPIVKSFKITTTRKTKNYVKNNKMYFKYKSIWQLNYYEQVIRNEMHYFFVEEYINLNPANWGKDKYSKIRNFYV